MGRLVREEGRVQPTLRETAYRGEDKPRGAQSSQTKWSFCTRCLLKNIQRVVPTAPDTEGCFFEGFLSLMEGTITAVRSTGSVLPKKKKKNALSSPCLSTFMTFFGVEISKLSAEAKSLLSKLVNTKKTVSRQLKATIITLSHKSVDQHIIIGLFLSLLKVLKTVVAQMIYRPIRA